jgi:hypothetical protein
MRFYIEISVSVYTLTLCWHIEMPANPVRQRANNPIRGRQETLEPTIPAYICRIHWLIFAGFYTAPFPVSTFPDR